MKLLKALRGAGSKKSALALGIAGMGGLVFHAFHESRSPQLSRETLVLERAGGPKAKLSELRLLHLADLHFYLGREDLVDYVRSLAREDFHGLILTGDNLSRPDGFDLLRRALEVFAEARLPGAFVFGSHDYWHTPAGNPLKYLYPKLGIRPKNTGLAPKACERKTVDKMRLDTQKIYDFYRQAGWVDLNNQVGHWMINGRRIALAGVDDPHIRRDRFPLPTPVLATSQPQEADLSGRVAREDWESSDIRLGLTHAPYQRVLNAFAEVRADLVLSGHTHGGQVCLPGGRALVTNCDLPVSLASGLFSWPPREVAGLAPKPAGRTWVNVSPGLGQQPWPPVRFACPPQAHLLTLKF